MSHLRTRIDRRLRRARGGHFAREIAASVIATLIGSAAISHFAAAPPASPAAAPKSVERLAAEISPERAAMIRETSTLFAPPAAAAVASLRVAAPADIGPAPAPAILRVAETGARRPVVVAARPPARPTIQVASAVAEAESATAVTEPAAREPVRIFGWGVPGSDRIPTGAETAQAIAEVGRTAAAIGGSLGERIGLR